MKALGIYDLLNKLATKVNSFMHHKSAAEKVRQSLHLGGRKLPRAVKPFKYSAYVENPNQRRVVKLSAAR